MNPLEKLRTAANAKPGTRVIGIDLGTTNSTVAQVRLPLPESSSAEFACECVPLEQATQMSPFTGALVPSVVAIDKAGKVWIGEGAKRMRAEPQKHGLSLEKNLFYETKNDMGLQKRYHRAAEDFVLAAHDRKALTGIVVRLSNGFGAPAHPDVNVWMLLVNDLCRQAVETGSLQLRSSGLQVRNFITVGDVGRAVHHLIALPTEVCGDGLFNLGGENSLRIIDLTELIARRCVTVLGFDPPILRPEPRLGEESMPLDFRTDKLKRTGFFLEGDFAGEIDANLRLCREAFGNGRKYPDESRRIAC